MRPRWFQLGLLAFLLIVFSGPGWAKQETAKPSESSPSSEVPAGGLTIDRSTLEAFIDGIISAELKSGNIAGVTFSLVKDGEILLAKGYGYSNVKLRRPVEPDRTLFRPGSVSKLVTWTAVMQMVEQGKLDLNADINQYLKKFQFPSTFPQPITLANLMSHTPGFEEVIGQMLARRPQELISLEDYLARNMPARIFPPGKIPAYSNYGTALAGYLVELVSGEKFEDYVEKHVFAPLGMTMSTFWEPLPDELAPFMSTGYIFRKGGFEEKEFELFNGLYPAGSMSSTAVDMARFMIAHLQNGRLGEAKILEEETAKLMHSRLFSVDPRLDGNAHGFWEKTWNGLRMIEHGGDTIYFHSQLVLFPEYNLGYFVSMNTGGARSDLRNNLLKSFLERYFTRPLPPEPEPFPDFKQRAQQLAGSYLFSRAVATKLYKAMSISSQVSVAALPNNHLFVGLPGGLGSRQWVEIEPYFFKEVDGAGKLLFGKDEKGRIRYLYFNEYPFMIGIKAHWYEKKNFVLFALIACAVGLLSFLRWPLRAFFRRVCRRQKLEEKKKPIARWCLGLAASFLLIFLLGFMGQISNERSLMFGVTPALKIILLFPLLSIPFLFFSLIFAVLSFKRKYWTGCSRLHYVLILAAGIVMLIILQTWNLLGWKF
ncbi:MAG: serine hydrolase domain-containing protein [Candidatus Aminicenantales bacterium]